MKDMKTFINQKEDLFILRLKSYKKNVIELKMINYL